MSLAFLLLILLPLAIVFLIAINHHLSEKRRAALAQAAAKLGFTFSPGTVASGPGDQFREFQLFNRGHSKRMSNIIEGKVEDLQFRCADYRYTVGSGKHQHTLSQSVMCFCGNTINVPPFTLDPENVLHKIGECFGYQDIDFSSAPKFSKLYLLRSSAESTVRAFFSRQILSYFEQNPGWSIEAKASAVIMFRTSKICQPEALPAFLEQGKALMKMFRA